MFNPKAQHGSIVKRVFSGKDSLLLDEDGNILASVDNFTSKVTINTTQLQPLGSAIQQNFITGYSVDLTVTECIVMDTRFFTDLFEFFDVGRHSHHYALQSVIEGYDGK